MMWYTPAIIVCLGLVVRLHADELRVSVHQEGPTPRVAWSGLGVAYGYAVEQCAGLSTGTWELAPDIDLWPAEGTNWTVHGTQTSGFYRVAAIARGLLVTHELLDSLSQLDIWQQYGIPATYPVDLYRLTYTTFDPRGLQPVASGALAVPVGAGAMPLVSYQHGTIFRTNEAPSNPGAGDQAVGIGLASDGYAVAMPDYLGLGVGSVGLHPYLHARSEAVACVDLLRAGRMFMTNDLSLALTGQLFVLGYSQGGHATLALHRELEQHHAAEFPLTASAPMAGPYDMSGVMQRALLQEVEYENGAYVAYLLFGLNAVYRVFDSPHEILEPEYALSLPPLLDGAHGASAINAAMPAVPAHIFQPAFTNLVANDSNHVFRAALRANDLIDWTPAAPTRLYHCAGDTVVSIANSQAAYSNFVANGATDVLLVDPSPTSDHGDGAAHCFLAAKAWFDTLRVP